jgi:hypothetical protein
MICTVYKVTSVASYTVLSKLCVTHHFIKQLPHTHTHTQTNNMQVTAVFCVSELHVLWWGTQTGSVGIVMLWSLMNNIVFME